MGPPAASSDHARLLSYNVYYASIEEDPSWAWEARRESVVSTVRFHRPDVVALQECWQGQLADVRERLAGYDWYGQRAAGGEHTPVGYRRDRFERETATVYALSETPTELGSVGWGARYPRFATQVRLTDRRSGTSFTVVSTHLDHESERARLEGARLLADRVREADADAVALAGDFNCPPGSDPYEALTADGPLADARSVAPTPHHGPEDTYVGTAPGDETEDPASIDHVFVTPAFDVVQTGVCVDTDAQGRYPSDHLPVVADLRPTG